MKMEEINKIIRDLWRSTYRGQGTKMILILFVLTYTNFYLNSSECVDTHWENQNIFKLDNHECYSTS